MDTHAATLPHKRIDGAAKLLRGASESEAGALLAASCDIVVVVDENLIVEDVSYADPELSSFAPERWIGQSFASCVTSESLEKTQALLSGALGGAVLVGRQVNHPLPQRDGDRPGSRDLAVSYRAVGLRKAGRSLLFGNDLRVLTDAHERLLRAQIRFDRDTRTLREAETRYRLLFQLADVPLLIVEAATMNVVDANDAASDLFGRATRKLKELSVPALFARSSQPEVAARIAEAAATGRQVTLSGTVNRDEPEVELTVEPYREIGGNHLLVRGGDPARQRQGGTSIDPVLAVVQAMPDGVLVIDRGGFVIDANEGALDFVRLASRDRVVGRRADRWVGATPVDMQVLIANLREEGAIRRFDTVVRDELGGTTPVEVSAVLAQAGGEPVFGLVLREASGPVPQPTSEQASDHSNVTELVGRVPLRDLVRDTADIIEKLCIEEALRQTDNNRASAADMLGLSRQSLYMKLKRYGLEDGPRPD